ncbi:substrate-binding domain-containing protein [Hyphomicrobium sp. CS1BSMeth3]|uniref:substrate-binding domain-containing protein n=1 Tax=Hyphomicrobium sp. CS1BSMeth3 TaxID=1892844 RepID=UPI001160C1AD|nr:substrate-binding domain-containing protein [Hyphomicrobium sp. CS1BSMeth3]
MPRASTVDLILTERPLLSMVGCRIPDDVSIISIGDPDFARTHVPPIAALRVSTDDIVERTVELLLKRIKGDRSMPPQRALVQFDFKPRQSCGPLRAPVASSGL